MANRRAYILGVGLNAAGGASAQANYTQLLSGFALHDHRAADQSPDPHRSRVTQLALLAAGEAIAEARWDLPTLQNERTGLLIGSSKGPIEDWVAYIQGHAALKPMVGVGAVAMDVGAELQMKGPRLTLASACASGLQALVRANDMIRTGAIDRALVIGTESSLHPLFQACFARLGVLSKTGACRPFDQKRDGFLMSEAAAAVCIEAGSDARGLYIDHAAMLSDAHHITGIDPAGVSLRYLLKQLNPHDPVDLVHAHGTATDSNDPVELSAIDDAFGQFAPAIYSHKAALGHTQGAAGMIGVVLNVLMHRYQTVLPNPNTIVPLSSQHLLIPTQPLARPIRRSIILAAGFGGAIAGVTVMNRV